MTRVALVTGGQRGIGLAIAETLAGAGWRVAIAAEVASESDAVREALGRLGPDARYLHHDLADLAGIPALLDRVEADLGPVTTFVSNAGVPARVRGDLLDVTADNWDFTLSINLRGAFFLAQEVARRMARSVSPTYRSLTFVTSASAAMVSPERGEYCVSKAGAAMVAQLFAARLAPLGIGVFDLRPGIIDTDMTAAVRDRYTARIEGGLVPAARWGTPADIAAAVLPIAEGRLAFATGAVVPLDGGLSIPRL